VGAQPAKSQPASPKGVPLATMPAIHLPGKSAPGAGKPPGSGSSSGQHKAVAPKPGSQHGTAKSPTSGSASGQKAAKGGTSGSASGQKAAKGATSGSASGQQKAVAKTSDSKQGVQKKPGSHQGTQKKPAAKPARNGATGDPFSNLNYDDAGGQRAMRRRRRSRMFGNLFVLIIFFVFLAGLGLAGLHTYFHFQRGGTLQNLWASFNIFGNSGTKPTEDGKDPAATDPKGPNGATNGDDPKPTDKKPDPPMVVRAEEPAVITTDKITAHVRISAVAVEVPAGKGIEDKDKRFLVRLQVENKGKNPINFQGWGVPEAINEVHPPMLLDSAGAGFKRMTYPGATVEGMALAETIEPGKSLNDLVVFEIPPATGAVKVELSAENLDVSQRDRKFTFVVPSAMLAKGGLVPKPDPKVDPKKPDPKPEPEPPPKEPAVVAVQRAALKSKLMPSRLEAVNTLAELGPAAASATPDLMEVLRKDTSEGVRAAAAECLGKFGPKAKEAIPALIEALKKDEFWKVRAEAATALVRMGADAKADGLPALQEALKVEKDEMAKKAIEEAIKRLGGGAVAKDDKAP
jgi:hypothetical protein